MIRRLRDLAPALLVALALIAVVYGLVWAFVTKVLLPPETVSMAAGREGGGYYRYAVRYQTILRQDGITLEVLETAGSVENAGLLEAGTVDLALIQGGVPISEDAGLEALAAVFLEPFLVFHRRSTRDAADLADWEDLRVAAGEPGSGTRAAVEAAARGLGLSLGPNALLPIGGAEAAEALLADRIDAAVFVAPIVAPYLQPLLNDPDIAIGKIRDPEALVRRLPFVRMVDIPAAGVDYALRIPRERVPLVAMVATLAARDDLHPALVDRLVHAALRIHSGSHLLSTELTFPSTEGVALPMDRQAASLITSGPSPLGTVLPYWMTAQVTKVLVFLVPLLVLILPILRIMPGLFAMRIRYRIFRFYNQLVEIETELEAGMTDARRDLLLKELEAIDRKIAHLAVPTRFRELSYALRVHVDLVRRRLMGEA